MNSFRPLARSFRSIKPSPATSISRSNLRFASSSSSTTPLRSTSKDSLYVIGAFTAVTLLFSTIASSVHLRLDSPRSIDPTLENNDQDPPSAFLHATGGKIKDFVGPVFSRDQVTCVMVIGSPLSGKTEQVRRIANRFDFQVEEGELFSLGFPWGLLYAVRVLRVQLRVGARGFVDLRFRCKERRNSIVRSRRLQRATCGLISRTSTLTVFL